MKLPSIIPIRIKRWGQNRVKASAGSIHNRASVEVNEVQTCCQPKTRKHEISRRLASRGCCIRRQGHCNQKDMPFDEEISWSTNYKKNMSSAPCYSKKGIRSCYIYNIKSLHSIIEISVTKWITKQENFLSICILPKCWLKWNLLRKCIHGVYYRYITPFPILAFQVQAISCCCL